MTNFESILLNWKKNTLSPSEKVKLLDLLDQQEGEAQFHQFWEKNWGDEVPPQATQPEIDQRLEAIRLAIKSQIHQDKQASKIRRSRLILSMAAGIAALVVGGWLLWSVSTSQQEEGTTTMASDIIETQVGKGRRLKRVALADGTLVWLNVASKLRYPTSFSDTLRKVWVEGEAYFKVAEEKDRPFVVSVQDLETEVLGTTFYVSAYPGASTRITLASGSVRISNLQDTVILAPQDQLVAEDGNTPWRITQVDLEAMGQWRDGLLAFSEIPLGTLAPTLERWYGYPIMFESTQAQDCKIIGKPTNKSIWDLLESYRLIRNITYEIDEEGVIHIGGGDC